MVGKSRWFCKSRRINKARNILLQIPYQAFLFRKDGFHLQMLILIRHLLAIYCGFLVFLNAANKYEILNSSGDRLLLVAETTDLFTRLCYGGWQPFQLSVYRARPLITLDPNPKEQRKEKFIEVLRFEGNPGACGNMGYINVTDGRKALGSVQQLKKYSRALYSVRDSEGIEILQIKGPEMCMCCVSFLSCRSMAHVEFEIINTENVPVGRIAKQWGGIAREVFTKADIWGLKYATDMSLDTKTVLLAAVFLIDFQYFER
ncbi:Phospholipid scramblase 1 [Orchesella cincta]|uniref:Phospholipid scramblase n=1 Tax=Orchesella cincta TaxID=48709 RepID=A0A1D2MN65_ORCCI|nr:Phospholipid scramblase 1 [Orchesella cincta]